MGWATKTIHDDLQNPPSEKFDESISRSVEDDALDKIKCSLMTLEREVRWGKLVLHVRCKMTTSLPKAKSCIGYL